MEWEYSTFCRSTMFQNIIFRITLILISWKHSKCIFTFLIWFWCSHLNNFKTSIYVWKYPHLKISKSKNIYVSKYPHFMRSGDKGGHKNWCNVKNISSRPPSFGNTVYFPPLGHSLTSFDSLKLIMLHKSGENSDSRS